ncbi:hypothetical protein GGX14DRAFT_544700 [Mycena pura]|uniref:Uncharacterized protein n=1 Tax=Mycena pura TaxID=153505 RepID=A0AAD6V7I0_9AGAR|nr:hypothetical protein GGX14DRAFT_544700 [Mycena pura]
MDYVHAQPLSAKITASGPHNQLQSPLFGTLFPELRNLVFINALTEYGDPTRRYSKHSWNYRPGYEYEREIATNLLLTCRLIYLETHLAPVAQNEHVFWMYRPPPGPFVSDPEGYFQRMTLQQRAAIQRVRFFTQMYWLESRIAPDRAVSSAKSWNAVQPWTEGLSVPKLSITIRHSDWWHWETGNPLRMAEPHESNGWGSWVGSVPGLQELELEMESIDAKSEELEQLVRAALKWKFPLAHGGCLVHDGKQPTKSVWLGTSTLEPRGVTAVPKSVLGRPKFDPEAEARYDTKYPIALKLHVRKIHFKVAEARISYAVPH